MASLVLLAGVATAHPHKDVEQQALVSVGLDVVSLEVRIVPSFEEGAAIFAHIDSDANGVVSADEAAKFGAEVIEKTVLKVDGWRIAFSSPRVAVPTSEWVAAGLGVIEVDADAAFDFTSTPDHSVAFEIAYENLAHTWFVQPFFYADLMATMSLQSLERAVAGSRVEILFSPKGR